MRDRAFVGAVLSLATAATFGVLVPASKGALAHVGPLRAAALAHLAAGVVALLALGLGRTAGPGRRGRPASKRDASRLTGVAVLGGVVGPAMFFAGVERIVGFSFGVPWRVTGWVVGRLP